MPLECKAPVVHHRRQTRARGLASRLLLPASSPRPHFRQTPFRQCPLATATPSPAGRRHPPSPRDVERRSGTPDADARRPVQDLPPSVPLPSPALLLPPSVTRSLSPGRRHARRRCAERRRPRLGASGLPASTRHAGRRCAVQSAGCSGESLANWRFKLLEHKHGSRPPSPSARPSLARGQH